MRDAVPQCSHLLGHQECAQICRSARSGDCQPLTRFSPLSVDKLVDQHAVGTVSRYLCVRHLAGMISADAATPSAQNQALMPVKRANSQDASDSGGRGGRSRFDCANRPQTACWMSRSSRPSICPNVHIAGWTPLRCGLLQCALSLATATSMPVGVNSTKAVVLSPFDKSEEGVGGNSSYSLLGRAPSSSRFAEPQFICS